MTEQTTAEVDADTVAHRAAQVIASMGADIRALTGQRDRYRNAWCSARERAQAYGEGILRVVKDRESYQQWLRQAEEAAAVPAGQAPATDQAALRDRIAAAILARIKWATVSKDRPADALTSLLAANEFDLAAAVLAVLPASVDRAAVLEEAADELDAYIARYPSPSIANWTGAVAFLRRMADEAEPAVGAQQLVCKCPAEICQCGHHQAQQPKETRP